MIEKQVDKNSLKMDYESWSLLLTNILVLYLTIKSGGNFLMLLSAYWIQGAIITLFSVVRMLQLRAFSRQGITLSGGNGEPRPTFGAKIFISASFFLFFGVFYWIFFNILYFSLLNGTLSPDNIFYLKTTASIFFVERLITYIYIRRNDPFEHNIENPILGLIPLFFVLILGLAIGGSGVKLTHNIYLLLVFFGLKTLADLLAHFNQTKQLRDAKSRGDALTKEDAKARGWEVD